MKLATSPVISDAAPLRFPNPQSGEPTVEWDGRLFRDGNISTDVLDYTCTNEGWTDEHSEYTENTDSPNHFIALASRQHTLAELAKCELPRDARILEVGCSTGEVIEEVSAVYANATVIGSDVSLRALRRLAELQPGTPLMRFDLTECPLPSNSVDAVIALNVLEHIEDDYKAAREMFRILKPNGKAIIEVPAGPELYDDYDRFLHHFRRYSMSRLCKALSEAGFIIEYKSHLGCFIYPGFWAVKQLGKVLKKDKTKIDVKSVTRNIDTTSGNPLLKLVTDVELVLGNFLHYPYGIRCLVTCRKSR